MVATQANDAVEYCSVFRHGVDDKRRVQIPAKWRPAEGTEIEYTLVRWPHAHQSEACLMVFPPEQWKTLVDKVKAMPFAQPRAESLRRLLSRKSAKASLDRSGRICLPEDTAKAVGIEREAVLVGLLDRFQLWSPERYEGVSAEDEGLFAEAFELLSQEKETT